MLHLTLDKHGNWALLGPLKLETECHDVVLSQRLVTYTLSWSTDSGNRDELCQMRCQTKQ